MMTSKGIIVMSMLCTGYSISAFSQTTGKIVDIN